MRNRQLAFCATLFVALAPLSAHAETPPPAVPIAGGWSATSQQDARPAAAFAVAHLPRRHARLARIVSAERQVVAGTNYRMVLRLTDGTRWRVVVWQKLDRSMSLSEATRLR